MNVTVLEVVVVPNVTVPESTKMPPPCSNRRKESTRDRLRHITALDAITLALLAMHPRPGLWEERGGTVVVMEADMVAIPLSHASCSTGLTDRPSRATTVYAQKVSKPGTGLRLDL